MNDELVQQLLPQIADLLKKVGLRQWEEKIRSAGVLLKSDSLAGRSELLSLFGGMGSLNDVIIYKGKELALTENDELDALRQKLYDALH